MAEEKFNQDELVPPSFVNEAYIVDILRQVEDDPELHLINYDIKPGSKAGDHYASIMFKITASYGSRGQIIADRRFIFKTVPEAEGMKKEWLENSPAFKNEILMYTKTLPAMESILKEHGEKVWWPKLVYSQTKPFVLMFDDLTVQEYQVVYDSLDFKQLLPIVDKIAKYHAMSVVLQQKGHTEVTQYEKGLNSAMKEMFAPMVSHFDRVADIVKSWQGFEKIGEQMKTLGPKMADIIIKHDTTIDKGRFFVLNHGDFHLRNLMFQKDAQEELTNGIFLDFQMPVFTTPAMDLVGLLNMIGNAEVRKRKDEVLKMYHDQLVASLKLYGYEGKLPTGIDIQVEMLKVSHYDAWSVLLGIPMFSIKGVEMSELFNANDESPIVEGFRKAYSDPAWMEEVKPYIRSFYYRGVFDD